MSGSALRDEVRDEDAPDASPAPTRSRRALALADGLLDATVVALATWTLVYHAALLSGLGSNAALAVEGVVLVAVAAARRLLASPRSEPVPAVSQPRASPTSRDTTAVVIVAAAVVAASAMAFDLPWLLVWPAWLVAGVAGLVRAFTRPRAEGPVVGAAVTDTAGAVELWTVLACTLGLAAFSMVVLRPNPDDLFYVNWSQWVAAHGEFPLRDTLYSNLGYPLANWPPIASYDGLTGALAHLLGLAAGDVEYVAVPPLATALSVLALWRLLRVWRVRHRTVALLAAVAFLLVDGTSAYGSPGNLFATRLWQGKVILACVLVPVLLVHLLRFVERPTRARLGFLFLCGAAAVALSTTAIFLVPVVAVAGVAPLLPGRVRAAAAAAAATAAYPVGAGAVTLALGGRSADDFGIRRQYRFDPSWFSHQVFLTGALALLAVSAVLLGTLLLPHPAARVTTGVAVVAVGLTFVPGFTRLSYDVVGIGPTLWRLTWGCTIAPLVGAAASWLAGWISSRRAALACGAAAIGVLGVFGSPIWAADTGSSLAAPLHWQRGSGSRAAAAWLVGHAGAGTVLAPDGLSITVVVTTTDVKVVAPRDYYLDYLRDQPGFHYPERLLLWQLANGEPLSPAADTTAALRLLDVRAACVYREDQTGVRALHEGGYHQGFRTTTYRCFSASPRAA